MRFHPKWLLLAPPIVWAFIGLVALFAPQELGRHFYIFWTLNDAGMALALIGVIMIVLRGPAPAGGSTGREWALPPPAALEEVPVEELLRVAALHARRGR